MLFEVRGGSQCLLAFQQWLSSYPNVLCCFTADVLHYDIAREREKRTGKGKREKKDELGLCYLLPLPLSLSLSPTLPPSPLLFSSHDARCSPGCAVRGRRGSGDRGAQWRPPPPLRRRRHCALVSKDGERRWGPRRSSGSVCACVCLCVCGTEERHRGARSDSRDRRP